MNSFIYNNKSFKDLYGKLDKKSYFNIRNLAWHILIKTNITELPIDLFKIAKHFNIPIFSYKESENILKLIPAYKELCKQQSFTANFNDNKFIFFDNNCHFNRIQFNIAHELSHYFLSHILTDENAEVQADALAARLLMPLGVLHELNIKSAKDIEKFCQVSPIASEKRFKRYTQILLPRNKFKTSRLEKKVIRQFKKFIKENKIKE